MVTLLKILSLPYFYRMVINNIGHKDGYFENLVIATLPVKFIVGFLLFKKEIPGSFPSLKSKLFNIQIEHYGKLVQLDKFLRCVQALVKISSHLTS